MSGIERNGVLSALGLSNVQSDGFIPRSSADFANVVNDQKPVASKDPKESSGTLVPTPKFMPTNTGLTATMPLTGNVTSLATGSALTLNELYTRKVQTPGVLERWKAQADALLS